MRGLKSNDALDIGEKVESHSTRVRGLKCQTQIVIVNQYRVALYTSAWIEISIIFARICNTFVALYTSAWIEITVSSDFETFVNVALYTSAWIEITCLLYCGGNVLCRTLHECVD